MSTLSSLRARAELAATDYKRVRLALYRADGSKVYGDTEHQEREAALRGELLRELREVQRQVEQVLEEAKRELFAAENGAPTAVLSTGELERANALRNFAADDVESMTYDRLLMRLQAVRDGGDKPETFAYLQAGRKYAKGLTERIGAPDEAGRGSAVAALQGVVPNDLASVLDEMRDALLPAHKRAEIDNLKARIEEARDVLELAHSLQSGGRNAVEAYILSTYNDRLTPDLIRAAGSGQTLST